MTVAISNMYSTFANSSIRYDAIGMDVNASSYAVNSTLINLKTNGNTKFSVDVSGNTTVNGTIYISGSIIANGDIISLSDTGDITAKTLTANVINSNTVTSNVITANTISTTSVKRNGIESLMPVGSVIWHAANTAPDGYLKANGAAISRTTYTDLFAVIGTTYGVGDNSTTFNLPDLRGEFVRGWDDGRGVDSGRNFASSQTDAFQDHWHNVIYRQDSTSSGVFNTVFGTDGKTGSAYANTAGTDEWMQSDASLNTAPLYAVTATANSLSSTTGTPRVAAETRPRNISLLACIKY